MSERQDGDRIIVTGYSGGSHFPRTQAATQYRFEADGLSGEGPFHIDGSVYGHDLRLRGPGTIVGPILGRGDVTLHNHSRKVQRLLGGVHANGNLAAVSRGGALTESLVAGIEVADYVVRGDAIAEHVTLENAVVFGNVRGRQVRLTHCIVLGQVLAREAAIFSGSTLLAYDAPSVRFEGPNCMLFASGSSDRAPEFAPLRDGTGKTWECDVRFHPVLHAGGYSALTYRPWEPQSEALAMARLHPSDWVRVDAEKRVRKVRDGKVTETAVPFERYVLSVAGRALNFGALGEHLEHLKWMLKTVLEFEHYHPKTQQEVQRRWRERCAPDEVKILDLATRPTSAPLPVARTEAMPRN